MALACVKVHIFQYLPCFLSCLCVCNLLFIHYFKVYSFQFKKKSILNFQFMASSYVKRWVQMTSEWYSIFREEVGGEAIAIG